MNVVIKKFNDLSPLELYEILQLRSEVFVVEQDCVYQDIDGNDQKALHIIGTVENKIIAYTRCFGPGDYFKEASIGRVVVKESQRKFKRGNQIMNSSIKAINNHYKTKIIKISAQCYLNKFYTNLQFKSIGEKYLEDGIPHVTMVRE
ncbi:MAG: GNAT family N-acetyltransferase [Flavobacteriaceae bacterium]|jgi:ElaA protein|nr:GNAT family N-acetyltransferase [Flavobacteriaceae bacterium]MBT3871991.1 GNAT family N-acetyltransferase [Flavobacteriaceae bacterium]MBT3918847.1 GNAT family N-acetyltransferase [Flavobacteriaceae bacterium]MBT6704276.1 GNAT family N-acetyltransferase [Flavobacteriaceae bacterium]|tara:strand:+ start:1458 stop:1898 length:441 start_codon:yes stop_codon:yes gene_type:complete